MNEPQWVPATAASVFHQAMSPSMNTYLDHLARRPRIDCTHDSNRPYQADRFSRAGWVNRDGVGHFLDVARADGAPLAEALCSASGNRTWIRCVLGIDGSPTVEDRAEVMRDGVVVATMGARPGETAADDQIVDWVAAQLAHDEVGTLDRLSRGEPLLLADGFAVRITSESRQQVVQQALVAVQSVPRVGRVL